MTFHKTCWIFHFLKLKLLFVLRVTCIEFLWSGGKGCLNNCERRMKSHQLKFIINLLHVTIGDYYSFEVIKWMEAAFKLCNFTSLLFSTIFKRTIMPKMSRYYVAKSWCQKFINKYCRIKANNSLMVKNCPATTTPYRELCRKNVKSSVSKYLGQV